MATWGLRSKSLLALVLACLIAIVPTALLGWQVIDGLHSHFSRAYALNTTLLNRERIFAPVSREYALSRRFANSELMRQFMLHEQDASTRAMFFRDAEGWRGDFRDHSYFVANAASNNYYFNSDSMPYSEQSRERLAPDDAKDAWFFNTLDETSDVSNINVDVNPTLNSTKVWFNYVVMDGDRRLGIAGTGVDLSSFMHDFVLDQAQGVTPMILGLDGSIQAHPDRSMIALNSGTGASDQGHSIFDVLQQPQQREQVRQAMDRAEHDSGSVELHFVTIDGRRELLALTYIPELKWFVVNLIDTNTARVVDGNWFMPLLAALLVLLLLMLVGFAYVVDRLVLRPIGQLKQTAQAMAAGRYDVDLPQARGDEIGELSAAFGVMAGKVKRHTDELEERVRHRTQALEQANRSMAEAHQKISDSIDYASLIQRAILPRRDLVSALGERYAVLWRPRDVVGGDFYIYRAGQNCCLFGVVDCAGHGVPGALMTMLAHAALDQAIVDAGMADPAAVLARADQIVRAMLREDASDSQMLATNMDVGLAFVDLAARKVTFAGAKVGLYSSDGVEVEQIQGARRAVGDKRVGHYDNITLALQAGRTFYMTTDGFLDQAGGEFGYGFGRTRFVEMIQRHAQLPLSEQSQRFSETLAAYQGDRPQRDDITMLCFRFD